MVRYEGPPGLVGVLAQDLRDEGLEVSYEPPVEHRAQFPDPVTVVVIYAGIKTADAVAELGQEALKAAILHAIARWRERGRPGEATLKKE